MKQRISQLYLGSLIQEERVYNAAVLIQNREIIGIQHKINLSGYDVFDEKRYFKAGEKSLVFDLDDVRVGINIYEDIRVGNPTKIQAEQDAHSPLIQS